MLMEKRMYIALIFVAAFLCSYAQQSDKSTYLAHIQPSIRQNTYNPIIYTMQLALRLKPETTGWLSTGYSNA